MKQIRHEGCFQTKKRTCVLLALILVMPCLFGLSANKTNTSVSIDERGRLADELHMKGLMLYDETKYKEAIDEWLREIEIAPERVKPYNNIGLTYRKLGDLDSSIKFHEKAIKVDPKFGHSYYSLGLVYYDLKDYKRAKELFLKAIEFGYYDADVYYSLGQAYKQLTDYEQAIKAFKKVIKLYYNFPGAHYQLGDTYRLVGNFDMAKMELKREISINTSWELQCEIALLEIDTETDPTNYEAFFVLGMLYKEASGKEFTEKAIDAFRRVIELNPSCADAHFQLGQLYEIKGDLYMAEQAYMEEIQINPDHQYARQAIEHIRSSGM